MKRLFAIILAITLCLGLLPAAVADGSAAAPAVGFPGKEAPGSQALSLVPDGEGASGTCGPSLIWSLDEEGTLTISGAGVMTDYDSAKSCPWRSCAASVKRVVIGDGVCSIGDFAFCGLPSLGSVTIPGSVTSIGVNAFKDCAALGEIVIGPGVPAGEGAAVSVRAGLRGAVAGRRASAAGGVTIGGGVTEIGSFAFYGCAALTGIVIPEGVTTIGDYAFYGCASLGEIVIPDSVTTIGVYAFCGCTGLKTAALPDCITALGGSVFQDCEGLTGIVIPEGVTSVGGSAFQGCSRLGTISIPHSLAEVGLSAFEGCAALVDVFYAGSPDGRGRLSIGGNNEPLTGAAWHYTCENEAEILSGKCGAHLFWAFEDGILTISGAGEMSGWTTENQVPWGGHRAEIRAVVLRDGCASVGRNAFAALPGLECVGMPVSVTSVAEGAFRDCARLREVFYAGTEEDRGGIAVLEDNEPLGNAVWFWRTEPHDHVPGEAVRENDKAPTCAGEGGYDEVRYCVICAAEMSREKRIVEKLPHSWDDGVITREPTEREEGLRVFTCAVCGAERTEIVPVLPPRVPGDSTGDGKVNIFDLIRLRKHLAGMDVEFNEKNADVTGDGKVNIFDLIRLRKYLAGMDVVLE